MVDEVNPGDTPSSRMPILKECIIAGPLIELLGSEFQCSCRLTGYPSITACYYPTHRMRVLRPGCLDSVAGSISMRFAAKLTPIRT